MVAGEFPGQVQSVSTDKSLYSNAGMMPANAMALFMIEMTVNSFD
jgi:hypothetical protein